MTLQKTKVLVVGAGPTGLTTAIELARRNVDVRIVERRTEPSTRSKALVVHARTLELLDMIGIADRLVAKGYTSPGIDFSASADHPLRADMHALSAETRFPYILILPQAQTEAELECRLGEGGIEVERGKTLEWFEETRDGVVATIKIGNDETETITADYIVGADGPHSKVREVLGLKFEGSPYGWTALLGDITLRGHEAEGGTEQHSSDRGLAFIVPFEDGTHRIVTIDSRHQGEPKGDLELGELQESISAILGKSVELSDPVWLSRWGADLKLAERYGKGRAFIAGDAAHTHSPAGGQGMNTGIQDAFNLGWKLAAVVHGEAGAELLETFHLERHPIGEKVLKTSDLLLRSLLLRKPLWRKLRETLFEAAIPLPPVQHGLAMNLSGLGIDYGAMASKVGGRAPDAEIRTVDHETARLYELLRDRRSKLIVWVTPRQVNRQRPVIEKLIAATADLPVDVLVVLQNGVPAQHRFENAETYVDYRGELERKYEIEPGALVLIRPDGYVSVCEDDLDVTRFLDAYHASLKPRAPETLPHKALEIAAATTKGSGRKRALTLAALFGASAAPKLLGAPAMKSLFAGYGLSGEAMRATGLLEAVGAAAVTSSKGRSFGAAMLAVVGLGAARTHARAGEAAKMTNALILAAVAASVLWSATKRR